MIVFLPFSDLMMSVAVLDNARLQKQIVEAMQIYNSLANVEKKNHPAFKMWEDYENMLAVYGALCYLEWKRRLFIKDCTDHKHKSGE